MRFFHRLGILCGSVLFLSLAPTAQETAAAFEITAESIERLSAELRESLRSELGLVEFQCPVRLVDPEEVEEALFEENLPLMRLQFEDEEVARAQARSFSRSLSKALMAKYAFATDEIFVIAENIEWVAEELDRPELMSADCLRALLVHEFVHAADEESHGIYGLLASRKNAEEIQACNAVLEGHAQHVTRRLCDENGWSEGFELFTRAIGEVPPLEGEDEAMRMLRRLQVDQLSTFYYDGERFVAAVDVAGGDEAIARLFREPPPDLLTIFHPEWYLDPTTRPVSPFDLEAALDQTADIHPEEGWMTSRLSLTPNQVELAMSLLPAEVVARVAAGLRHNRVATYTAEDGSGMILVALYEMTSPAEAAFYVDSALRINRIKDEGEAIEFESVRYVDLGPTGRGGFLAEKQATYLGQDLSVSTVVLASGVLCAELVSVNAPVTVDELQEQTERLLRVAEQGGPAARSPEHAESTAR